jgi:DNA-binding PadR family transcriptional regulator
VFSPGTLYPILERMERNGWLRAEATKRANARRNYRITVSGRRILDRLRTDVDELYRELVLGIEPAHARVARDTTAKATRRARSPSRARRRPVPREGRRS